MERRCKGKYRQKKNRSGGAPFIGMFGMGRRNMNPKIHEMLHKKMGNNNENNQNNNNNEEEIPWRNKKGQPGKAPVDKSTE